MPPVNKGEWYKMKFISVISWRCRWVGLVGIGFFGCSPAETETQGSLFTEIKSEYSGIEFSNDLPFNKEFNIYTYRNFYNGGGVALGDVNNDGLLDVYFSSNLSSNKLFLNKGNFKFEDITDKAGVQGASAWSTGVSMADVNADGLLDIYVCNSGDIKGDNKENELFINNGDLTFTDRAKEMGVADPGYSTHAAFFDFDNDTDLDLYILNNSYQAIGSFNLRKNVRGERDKFGGDKLLRNDNGLFTDVSEAAGIYGSVIGFGLGVTVGDINKDGWQDIYVCNDFFERDYLYINNKNGTFKECLPDQIRSISGASMGADLADINNDGWADLFVTEMLPKENDRLKTVTTFEDWNRYQYNLENGYYHQFTRNILQLNNGNDTFSEIGRLAGVEATDWSWGALLFDMDNDGLKDIFVANGIFQDLTNQDFLQYASNDEFVKSVLSDKSVSYKKLTEIIPSNPIPNFAFRNDNQLSFTNKADEWGLGRPGFSNGSAYGDIDNDGDLDIVVNNVNMPSFVYRNETNNKSQNHFLKFILKGEGKNTFALGTKITLHYQGGIQYLEQMPMRGFESTVDPRPNFGLGTISLVDSVLVQWPSGKITRLYNIKTDQIIQIDETGGVKPENVSVTSEPMFEEVKIGIDFVHQENEFVDFDRDKLIYHMLSTEGPRISVGDLNGDNLSDFFVGGAKDQPGAIIVQGKRGFSKLAIEEFGKDRVSEDLGSEIFDADGDGDMDLYVCSGGNEFSSSSVALVDRLYFNTGDGGFKRSDQILPIMKFESTSVVKAADVDSDGDKDLFVGVRLQPFSYGINCNGYILENDGKGKFSDVTNGIAPALSNIGMITDAVWADVDKDGDPDLMVIGEYMPVKIFINSKGKLIDESVSFGLSKTNGWWNRIKSADLDNDGDLDFVIGNHGLNSRFRADSLHPVRMHINDFDNNGNLDQIISTYNGEVSYPLALRHDLIAQIPSLKKRYVKYEDYKGQSITDIFSAEQVRESLVLEAFTFSTSILINNGPNKWKLIPLPLEAQYSTTYGISIYDFNRDGKNDILLGGNLFEVKPEMGRYDGSYGTLLEGKGNGQFVFNKQSGLKLEGAVRDIETIEAFGNTYLVITRNNASILTFKLMHKR
jgi:enediyne biosynthesis protein E4